VGGGVCGGVAVRSFPQKKHACRLNRDAKQADPNPNPNPNPSDAKQADS